MRRRGRIPSLIRQEGNTHQMKGRKVTNNHMKPTLLLLPFHVFSYHYHHYPWQQARPVKKEENDNSIVI